MAHKYAVGDNVVFKGYGEDVPEDEQILTEGETYEVVENDAKEKTLGVQLDNPDFNSKKKASDENPKTIIVDVFYDEVDPAGEEEPEEEAVEEKPARGKAAAKAAPAKTAVKGRTKAAPVEEEPEEELHEEEPEEKPARGKVATKAPAKPVAKTTAKGKAEAKPAAKGKAVAKPAKEEPAEEEFPELETEDEEIVALVEGAADILELAEELVEEGAALDYKLGGVLYHVRLSKAYQKLDKSYKENGGFGLYVKEKLSIEYRKAMYLIDIYFKFNQYGIDAAKVQELGWTKCAKIAAVMNDENAEELVELAEKSSVSELNDTIKESYKEVGGEKGEKRKKIAFKFRLWEDQAAGVDEVITATAEAMGFKDLSDAFEHIVMEWAAEHPISTKKSKAAAKATTTVKSGKKVAARA